MNNKQNEQEHQEYLNKFLSDTSGDIKEIKKNVSQLGANSSLEYLDVALDMLPAGIFYKKGTKIKIRSAKVFEIQAYSVVDDTNVIDVTEKMNSMLASCVRYINPDGSIGTYKQLKDADRLYLIFMVRELTFQKGNNFIKDMVCPQCKTDNKIPFRATNNATIPKTFVNYEIDNRLKKFYDTEEKNFKLIINNVEWRIAPPTIGIQEIVYSYLKKEVTDGREPNVHFIKVLSHLLYDRDKISDEGLKAKEKEIKNWDYDTNEILNKFIDLIQFGIKELKYTCSECGGELRTPMMFPDRASTIFSNANIFDDFINQ